MKRKRLLLCFIIEFIGVYGMFCFLIAVHIFDYSIFNYKIIIGSLILTLINLYVMPVHKWFKNEDKR
jgi:hypothetical protein